METSSLRCPSFASDFEIKDRKGTPKNLFDKDFAELLSELQLVRLASEPLFYWVVPPNLVADNSLVLFLALISDPTR